MKSILFLVLALSVASLHSEERALLMTGDMEVGFMGGPMFRLINIVDKNKVTIGGFGAILINKHLYIGGAGGGTARDIGNGYSSTSYGGGLIGTFIQPNKAMHYYIDVGVYSGNLSPGGADNNPRIDRAENFLIIEPSVGLALNVMEYAKMIGGISYRYADSIDEPSLDSQDLGGIGLHASVIFGTF